MYSIGLDFGTNSARGVMVSLESGEEIAEALCPYPSGKDGVLIDPVNHNIARQNPADYHHVLKFLLSELTRTGLERKGFAPDKVAGIGVDTTGSTPIPVDNGLTPLCFHERFKNNINAMAYLWKDHSAHNEASEITELAMETRPQYLKKIGGIYSSEWFWAKLLYLARNDRDVFEGMDSFVELCDYIPAVLCGKRKSREIARSVCAAGHKALYSDDWQGLPDNDFLLSLSPMLDGIRDRLYSAAYPAGSPAGGLCREWAEIAGLPEGIPVSVGAFDAHMGAVGSGIREGMLVKVIGTSSCDMAIAPLTRRLPDIPGICGIVPDSIVPGFYGIEAGQSAVGDIFYWFTKNFINDSSRDFQYFTRSSETIKPGQSGLLSLDWHNGNRNILADQKLTGMIIGLTLQTRPEEVYRALIEATGFGARVIIERMQEYGVEIDEIITTGGIPEKNPLLMQIYADITQRSLKIAGSSQTCALGAAIFGAVAAGKNSGGFDTVIEAQKRLCHFKSLRYKPEKGNGRIYDRLYKLYRQLHDSFGKGETTRSMDNVMKELLKIKEESSGA